MVGGCGQCLENKRDFCLGNTDFKGAALDGEMTSKGFLLLPVPCTALCLWFWGSMVWWLVVGIVEKCPLVIQPVLGSCLRST